MEIDRVDFSPISQGGDDVTGALTKLDQSCADLAAAVGDPGTTSGGLFGRVIALEGVADGLGNAATRNVGTTAGTVAAGNDSRLRAVGTTSGTVAAGDDARIVGAAAKTYVDAQDATKLPVANPVYTGMMAKLGVQNVFCFRVNNANSDNGIGGAYADWAGNLTPALQVDCQNNQSHYLGIRWTHWGVKHLAAIHVIEGTTTTAMGFHFSTGTNKFLFNDTGNATFAGTLTQNSDYRIKDAVEEVDPEAAAAAVRMLRPIEYTDNRLPSDSPRSAGFIAHEVQQHLPLLVVGEKDAVDWELAYAGDTTPYPPGEEPEGWVEPVPYPVQTPVLQSVSYDRLVVYLTACWQEHDRQIAELKQQLGAALDRIDALSADASNSG